MWDQLNRHIDRLGFSQQRADLVSEVMMYFEIPSHGVCIVFDDSDYGDINMGIWSANRALYKNVEVFEREDISPEHLLEIMNERSHAHLVWCSKRVGLSNDIDFAWTLAHELRHLEQDYRNPLISRVNNFLYKAVDLSPANGWWGLPAELDAELTARRVTSSIYVDPNVIDRLSINNIHDEARIEFLKGFPLNEEANVERSTADFIRQNLFHLTLLLDDDDSDLNLIEICEALDPSPNTPS